MNIVTEKIKQEANQDKGDLKVDQIVLAEVNDSLGQPQISGLIDNPAYKTSITEPLILRGVDIAELRVLSVNNTDKEVKLAFHASSVLNPNTSTGRIIMLTYSSMRNTVFIIFKNLLSFNR